MNNNMNELQLNGLALELIDLAQARGALSGDAISALSLAAGTLIANTAKPDSRETLLRACIAVITEIASAGPHALPPPPKKSGRLS